MRRTGPRRKARREPCQFLRAGFPRILLRYPLEDSGPLAGALSWGICGGIPRGAADAGVVGEARLERLDMLAIGVLVRGVTATTLAQSALGQCGDRVFRAQRACATPMHSLKRASALLPSRLPTLLWPAALPLLAHCGLHPSWASPLVLMRPQLSGIELLFGVPMLVDAVAWILLGWPSAWVCGNFGARYSSPRSSGERGPHIWGTPFVYLGEGTRK